MSSCSWVEGSRGVCRKGRERIHTYEDDELIPGDVHGFPDWEIGPCPSQILIPEFFFFFVFFFLNSNNSSKMTRAQQSISILLLLSSVRQMMMFSRLSSLG